MTEFLHGLAKLDTTFFFKGYRHLAMVLGVVFVLQFLDSYAVHAQVVVIPREGFPYCQPFTGNGPFDNTILGGEIRIPVGVPENPTSATIISPYSANPTGNSLELTPYVYWHSGYAIVDIPFSSQFGIKTSFEYFSYGPFDPLIDRAEPADGISFFMFDADQPLKLGYLGGSLGYAPAVDPDDGSILVPGISGGYVGIGFDERGNFARGTVGEPIENWLDGIGNSITVRGPQVENYDVVERYHTNQTNFFGTDYFPPPSVPANKWFNIDHISGSRSANCNQPGYRKVFIELIPSGSGYQIKIDMLVNTTANGLQQVSFPLIDYPYNAPDRLKIGFAGSTGYGKNFHEIRNVTVNVSSSANLLEPQVTDQLGTICVGDGDVELEFKSALATQDAFITCLQLFGTNPGPPDNSFPTTDLAACGLDGSLCVRKCDSRFYEAPAYDENGDFAGTFYAELQDLNTDNFDQLKDVVNVRFEPVAGFSGQATVYYNVTDNYGLTSQPAKITVIANPFPTKIQDATIDNPSCDGQQDGRIYNVIVGDLVNGFDYEWLHNGNSIGQSGATVSSLVNGQATFELIGVNLGTYTLNVWNPSDNTQGGCYETVDVIVDQEDGTPVVLDVPEKTICEGESVSFLPAVDPDFNPGNSAAFLWYQSADRAGGALVSGSTIMVGGSPVEVEIAATGELILSGLKHSGTSATYEFFVEVKNQTNPGGNFCPFLGDIPTKAVAKVNPPLNFQVTHTDDWCLSQEGEIQGTVTGATDIIYTLLDENGQELESGNTGVFSGLSPGSYQVVGTSASLGCSTPVEKVEIEGPDNTLGIVPVEDVNAYCSQANGSITFQVTGGNLPYQSIVVDGTAVPFDPSGDYSLTGLSPKAYAIVVTDAQGCSTSIQMGVEEDPASNFTVIGSEVCEGMVATASIATQDPSTGTPQFNWYLQNSAGDYVEITDGFTFEGVTYGISPAYELSATGYSVNTVAYEVFLRVTGDRICDQGYIPAELKVTPGPPMDAPVMTDACHGESNGTIQAKIPGGNYSDFEFSLEGNNGVSIPFAPNDGLFEALPAGTYVLSIRNSIGCVTTLKDVVVIQPDAPITVNQPSIERASCNLPNGLIKDLEITGGWGDYTVEWHKDAPDGDIVPGNTTGIEGLLSGTYYLIVTDGQGCQATFDFKVEESSDPVYELVPPVNVCEGEQASIKPIHIAPNPSLPPTAFTEVIWYKEPGQVGAISSGADPNQSGVTYTIDDSDWLNPSLNIDGLASGTHDFYFYVVCTGQELKAEINVYEVPDVVVTTSSVSCFGSSDGKVTLTSGDSPSYTYVLNGGTPISQDALEALGLLAGDYELEVNTPAGCPQELSFTVEGPEASLEMTPLVGVDPGCGAPNGKLQTTISGGWAPYTVTVRDPDNPIQTFTTSERTIEIDGLVSGFYSIEIIDSENCVITSPDLELVDGPTQINLKDQQICEGQAVTLVPNIDPPSADAVYNWYLDAGHTQKITADSSPTTGGIVYAIDSENGELTITGLSGSATAYQYFIEVTGTGVCENAGQASVMVYTTPTASVVPMDEVCFGEGGTITINASGGSGKYSYSLDGAAAQESNVFKNVTVGTHTVQVLTPETCKVIVEDIEIEGPEAPLVIKVSDMVNPTCNLSNGELTLQLTGGYSPYSVEIFQNKVSRGKATPDENGLLVIPAIGSGDYEFTVTDAGGCTVSLNEPLELVEVPTTIQIDDQKICEGEEVVLTPKVPANISNPVFTWFFDESLSIPLTAGSTNGITYSIASDGTLTITGLLSTSSPFTYYVMVDGEGICAVVPEKVQVDVSQYPTLRVSNPSIVCDPDGTVDLTDFIEGYNPSIYEYNIISPLGNALVGSDLNAVHESGNYEVSVSSKGSSCWTDSKRILVRISEELVQSDFQYHADLGGGNIVSNEVIQLLENVDFEDFSTGDILIWEWDFGDGSTSNEQNPSHIFQNKGTYTVSLTTTDSIGCQSVYSVLVEVKDDYLLMMPNAFTPDGVKNQYYKPKHRGIAGLEFYIFTTWGELIYESNSLEDQGWDGTLNGKPAPNGNYAYKVKYRTKSGNEFDEAGVFILIR